MVTNNEEGWASLDEMKAKMDQMKKEIAAENKKAVEEASKEELYQQVIITLSDGSHGFFFGRAMVDKKLQEEGVVVKKVEFTLPRELPEGYAFGPTADEKEEENGSN